MLANECALVATDEQEGRGRSSPPHSAHQRPLVPECTSSRHRSRGYPARWPQRPAPRLQARSAVRCRRGSKDPLSPSWIGFHSMPWPSTKRTPAGGRVVTETTDGAAGVVPAVAHCFLEGVDGANQEGTMHCFLVAPAMSPAIPVKCLHFLREQSALPGRSHCSPAPWAQPQRVVHGQKVRELRQSSPRRGCDDRSSNTPRRWGRTPLSRGMTCDPVGSLVQVPCIERRAPDGGGQGCQRRPSMAVPELKSHKLLTRSGHQDHLLRLAWISEMSATRRPRWPVWR